MSKAYIFLAPGFEELEFTNTFDVLRRGGVEVVNVAVGTNGALNVRGAHGLDVVADAKVEGLDTSDADWLILPGGLPGATNLAASVDLSKILTEAAVAGRNIAAICASPAMVLYPLGILNGKKATCYPGCEPDGDKTDWTGDGVVEDGNIITGKGPAFAIPFAAHILAAIKGKAVTHDVAQGMLMPEFIAWGASHCNL